MEDNTGYPLEKRTLSFSANIVKYCAILKQPIFKAIVDQLIRSATSIGANYAEANNASSKADFRAKIYIAKKEAAETKYWLRLLIELGDNSDTVNILLKEAQQILMILQKILNTMRENSENRELRTYRKLKTEN